MNRVSHASSRPRPHRTLLFLLTVGLAIAPGALAQTSFSAAVSGYRTGGCGILAFPIDTPSLEWLLSPGRSTVPRFSGDVQTIDSADGRDVFAIVWTGVPELSIVRVLPGEPPLHVAQEPFFSGLPGYYGRSLAVAKDGRVFATVVQAASSITRLAVISSTGSLERLGDLPSASGDVAVAADGCTLFFADGFFIRSVNGCTGGSLTPFSTMARQVVDLAVLSTGDVLALTDQSLIQLAPDGSTRRTFSLDGVDPTSYSLDAMDVSSDESVIGVAAMRACEELGQIIALALPDGRELWRQETSYLSTATGLVIGAGATAAVPTLSDIALLLLAATLAALAIGAIRH